MTTSSPLTIKKSLDLLKSHRLVVIIRLDDLSQAEALTHALLEGGIRALEFTLTNDAACDVVADLRKRIPAFDAGEALIGVGSIRTVEQTQYAIDSGAQFLVSPVLLHEMIEIGRSAGIATMPGAFSPTEIASAQEAGASVVKVFPADTLSPAYIKAVLAPMPELRLMPTGGINFQNLREYLRAGAFAVGVGGSLVNARHIADGRWNQITQTAREYAESATLR
jgi:2-dehydro-3-deoxyphosphogluconate aldolase / (4S)-4-hydroxy-2-oxoglutarate aldolase